MTQTFATIEALQSQIAHDLDLGTDDILSAAYCAGAGAQQEQRRCLDMIVEQGVLYLESKKPSRKRDDEERYLRKVKRRSERIARGKQEKAGFVPLVLIGGAIVTWLVQKALDWLLNWYRAAKDAAAQVSRMCAGLCGAAWQDDEDDD